MMDEGPDGTDVVLKLFRERQRALNQPRNPLPESAVETFDGVGLAAALAYSLMGLRQVISGGLGFRCVSSFRVSQRPLQPLPSC